MQSTDGENWLPVVGFEGIYEVSDHGRVRGIDRAGSDGRRLAGRILRQKVHPVSGHRLVGLWRGQETTRSVHRLVLESFVGPVPDGHEVCHNNGVPDDNRLENLRYGTRSENQLDRTRHGSQYLALRTHCPRGHRLEAPNLIPSAIRKGKRNCLACDRARAFTRRRGIEFTKDLADQYYKALWS